MSTTPPMPPGPGGPPDDAPEAPASAVGAGTHTPSDAMTRYDKEKDAYHCSYGIPTPALAAAGDLLFDGNYMYLRHRPRGGSLLDLMGPWPWYIASAAALALALFWLLDRPFDGRRRGPRGQVGPAGG